MNHLILAFLDQTIWAKVRGGEEETDYWLWLGVEKNEREIIIISYLISEWFRLFFNSSGPDEKIKYEQKSRQP